MRSPAFDTLVLAATGYDGRNLRLDRVLPMFAAASPTTTLGVDEAWSAMRAFIPAMADSTTLAVVSRLPRKAPVLVTHSVHKTMTSLRQGSYLHALGSAADIEKDGATPESVLFPNTQDKSACPPPANHGLRRVNGNKKQEKIDEIFGSQTATSAAKVSQRRSSSGGAIRCQ